MATCRLAMYRRTWTLILVLTTLALGGGASPASAADQFATRSGSIVGTDTTQSSRILAVEPASSCGSVKPNPGTTTGTFHHDSYAFTNINNETQCIHFTVDPMTCTTSTTHINANAYLDSFATGAVATNWVANLGAFPNGVKTFSFDVPAGRTFVLVVNEMTADGGCAGYSATGTSDRPYALDHPVFSSSPNVGAVQHVTSEGTWAQSPTLTRQWRRCDPGGSFCADIPGATGTTYRLSDDDVGQRVLVRVTATDASGTSSVDSALGDVISFAGAPAPVYTITPSTGVGIVPGTDDTGNHVDDGSTPITFPFPVQAFGQSFASGFVGSNGALLLSANQPNIFTENCRMPVISNPPPFGTAIFPYYDDLRTDTPAGTGVFTTVLGSAPNRDFVVEWRASYFASITVANFEVILHENSPTITMIYGATNDAAAKASTGIQQANPGVAYQFSCRTNSLLAAGTRVDYVPSRPTIPASPRPGQTITATNATWSGARPITFSEQWEQCDASGQGCVDISGATDFAYTPTDGDLGHTLRLRVTASNATGTGSIDSAASDVVANPPPGGGPPPTDTTPPVLAGLKLVPSAFAAKASGGSIAAAKAKPKGTRVSYTDSEAATTTFVVKRAASGRRKGKACVKPTRRNRKAKHCTRYVAVRGSFRHVDAAGVNRFKFTGRVRGRKLAKGRYRLVGTARDGAGNSSKPVRSPFRIIG